MTLERVGDVLLTSADGVVRAWIDRPERKNAINDGVLDGLEAALDLARAEQAKVLVLRGSGGTFSSGADLGLLLEVADDEAALRRFMSRIGRVIEACEAAPFVTVAVVEGFALAGGCELLLGADVSLCTTDAVIGDRHAEYGLVPAAGASVRLPRAIPRALASYLLLSGDVLTGEAAAAAGLVSFAVAPDELEQALERVVTRLSSRARDSLAVVKEMLGAQRHLQLPAGLGRELELFLQHMKGSAEAREGLLAFRDGRQPVFDGPTDPPSGPSTAHDGTRRGAPGASVSSPDPAATG